MDDRAYLEVLRDAVRRREQLQNEMSFLKKKLADIDAFIAATERMIREQDQRAASEFQTSNSDSGAVETQAEPPRRRRNPTPPSRIAELAEEEILAQGRPMTRSELVTALEQRGVEMVAKDRAKNLGTILWRFSNRFENLPGEGYWPKSHPPPGKLV